MNSSFFYYETPNYVIGRGQPDESNKRDNKANLKLQTKNELYP